MSANKMKYYEVVTSMVVKANSQKDAIAITFGDNAIPGEVIQQEVFANRVLASELQQITAEN